jgi:AraC-like DNA-binding protein
MRLPASPQVFVKFVIEGEGVIRGPHGHSYPIATGNLVVVPEGASYQIETGSEILNELRISGKPEGDPPYRVCAGHWEEPALVTACGLVSASLGGSVGVFSHLRELLVVDLSANEAVWPVFNEILEEQRVSRPGATTVTSALMTTCLIYLFRHLGATPEPPLWLRALYNPRLSPTLDLILADPAADHSVASLAQGAAMSRSTFAEQFRSTFGISPMNFVTEQRVRAAAELLNQGLAVSEVAGRVGFSSRSHFSATFRKHAGVPPSRYGAR